MDLEIVNQCQLRGFVASEPVFGETKTGGGMVRFRIEMEETYKSRVSRQFVSIVAFGEAVKKFYAKGIVQGDEMALIGKLNTQSKKTQSGWNNFFSILMSDCELLKKDAKKYVPRPRPMDFLKPQDDSFSTPLSENDIPF